MQLLVVMFSVGGFVSGVYTFSPLTHSLGVGIEVLGCLP